MFIPKTILSEIPASVANREEAIEEWFDAYKMKAPWLDYTYRTVDGRTKNRKRLSLNAGKLVCKELNSLVFSESPTITTDKTIDEILKKNDFLTNFQEFSEYVLALGGGAMKIRYDGTDIILDFVKAHNFIPLSWDNKRVTEASFISHMTKDKRKVSLVETHRKVGETYVITNTMYDEETGRKVDLPVEYKATATILVDVPLFAYVKPAIANNFDPESPLGISIYGNAMDTLKALDIAFDGLNSEIVLGKKRIIVPANAIRTVVDENGKMVRYFDASDEVFSALNIDDEEALKIQDNSVELRITEIRLAIQTLFDILSIQVGFSAGYLSFDGGVAAKTATEVISDNSKTFKTKQSYENNLATGVIDLLDAMRSLIKTYQLGTVTDKEYIIIFDDSVIEDRNSKATYWINLYASGLAPLSLVLEKVHGVSKEEAQKMATELESKKTESVSLFGGGA
jgi:A118 family predicted phage portal protein